jgi:hypothetical protein
LHQETTTTSMRAALTFCARQFVLAQSLDAYGSFFKYIRYPLNYIYLALLIMCFLMSMGNRPAG